MYLDKTFRQATTYFFTVAKSDRTKSSFFTVAIYLLSKDLHARYYDEFYLVGCKAVQSVGNKETSKKQVESGASSACCRLHEGFLLGLFFYPENEGRNFLRNVGCLSMGYTALYSRRENSS
jgi:hypothetical protein